MRLQINSIWNTGDPSRESQSRRLLPRQQCADPISRRPYIPVPSSWTGDSPRRLRNWSGGSPLRQHTCYSSQSGTL